jgi:dTMP kinase
LLLEGDEITALSETLLFAAARSALVDEVIRPTLASGFDVICDRFVDSSFAYQGIVRGVGVETVMAINERATRGVLPDRTFLLVLDPTAAAARREKNDRIETGDVALKEALGYAYADVAAMFPERVRIIDASRSRDEIASEIREQVQDLP